MKSARAEVEAVYEIGNVTVKVYENSVLNNASNQAYILEQICVFAETFIK